MPKNKNQKEQSRPSPESWEKAMDEQWDKVEHYHAWSYWVKDMVKKLLFRQRQELIDKIRGMRKKAKKVNGMLPLRAEENRNGYNQALEEVLDLIK